MLPNTKATPEMQEYAQIIHDSLRNSEPTPKDMQDIRLSWAAKRHNAERGTHEWIFANLMVLMFARMAEVDNAQARLNQLIGR